MTSLLSFGGQAKKNVSFSLILSCFSSLSLLAKSEIFSYNFSPSSLKIITKSCSLHLKISSKSIIFFGLKYGDFSYFLRL